MSYGLNCIAGGAYVFHAGLHCQGIEALRRLGGRFAQVLNDAEKCWRFYQAYMALEMYAGPDDNRQEIFNAAFAVAPISGENTLRPYFEGFQALERAGSKEGMVEVHIPSRGLIDFTVSLQDGTSFGWVNTGAWDWLFWVVLGDRAEASLPAELEAAGFKLESGPAVYENVGDDEWSEEWDADTHAHLARTACGTVPLGDDAAPRGRGRRVTEVPKKYFHRRPQLVTA